MSQMGLGYIKATTFIFLSLCPEGFSVQAVTPSPQCRGHVMPSGASSHSCHPFFCKIICWAFSTFDHTGQLSVTGNGERE